MSQPVSPNNVEEPVYTRSQVNDIIASLKADAPALLKENAALAAAEGKQMGTKMGISIGIWAVAGYFLLALLGLLFMAGGFAFSKMWSAIVPQNSVYVNLAVGYCTMALAMLLFAALISAIAFFFFWKKKGNMDRTKAELTETINTLKASVARGKQSVETNKIDREALKQAKRQLDH